MEASTTTKKVVGLDDVRTALKIREQGGSWGQVIEATGFNGATLRPHITEYLQREVLNRPATEKGDRIDSPYAVIQSVELSQESIDAARKRGMAWYSIAKALGTSEAKVKGLASPELRGRQYAKAPAKPPAKPEPTAEDKAAEAKAAKAAKAKARREAKKATQATTA